MAEPRSLQPILRTMALFNRQGVETFQFCALSCDHVSEHEATIFSLVRALHDAPPQALRDPAAMLIDEDCIGELIGARSVLGGSLEAGGMFPEQPAAPEHLANHPGADRRG